MENKLSAVIDRINSIPEEQRPQVKGGKRYTMVQDRVEALRHVYGDEIGIYTDVLQINADLPPGPTVIVRCQITGRDGRVLATGHAKESWTSSRLNATAALENAETSAIGRALAAFGVHGGEFASSNEIESFVAVAREPRPAPVVEPRAQALPAPARTERDWLTFRDGIIALAQSAKTLTELREVWTSNIGELDDLKSENNDMYRYIFEKFQVAKSTVGMNGDESRTGSAH